MIIGHSEIMNRASANRVRHEKSVSAVKFTISVFSVVTVQLYSTLAHDSLQRAHTHALLQDMYCAQKERGNTKQKLEAPE